MTRDAKLSESQLERARTDTRLTIIGALTQLIERLSEDGTLNQSRIAERLGVSRQAISRLLSGPAHNNWTIDKIGELLAAMDARIYRMDMRLINEMPLANEIHPWREKRPARIVPKTTAAVADDQESVAMTPEIEDETSSDPAANWLPPSPEQQPELTTSA
jgi:predicted XRE-type DNA-binding protein